MDSQYEIHLVQSGHKEVIRISRRYMSEPEAWKIALLQAGACYGDIAQLPTHESIIALAERLSVSEVRWNKSSHTISFAKRSYLMAVKLCSTEII